MLIIDNLPILFALPLTKLLCFHQHFQLLIPFGLERVGHEPVVGIHAQITAACQFGFVAGSRCTRRLNREQSRYYARERGYEDESSE